MDYILNEHFVLLLKHATVFYFLSSIDSNNKILLLCTNYYNVDSKHVDCTVKLFIEFIRNDINISLKTYNIMNNTSCTLDGLLKLVSDISNPEVCFSAFKDLISLVLLFNNIKMQYDSLYRIFSVEKTNMDLFISTLNLKDDSFEGIIVDKSIYKFEFFDLYYVNEDSLKIFIKKFYYLDNIFGDFVWEKIPYRIINTT
jgi:hypothetical protein